MASLYARVFLNEARSRRDPQFDDGAATPTKNRFWKRHQSKVLRQQEKSALRRGDDVPPLRGQSSGGSRSYGRRQRAAQDGREPWDKVITVYNYDPTEQDKRRVEREKARRK